MTDTTIGQRIGAERKKLGLSQEALGEKVGVSRQAISKWEADAALPEIDKLIALSKLFGVSVGWLLGVEEAPAEQAEDIPETQLQLIEEIMKKYQPRPAKGKRLIAAILMVCLAAVIGLMWVRLGNLSARLAANEAQVDAFHNQVDSALAAMESQIAVSQTVSPTPALLADYTLEIVGVVSGDQPQAEIAFSAVPNNWQPGDSAALSIRRDGMATKIQDCYWDGAFLTARTFLDVADGYELCLTLTHGDNTQEQQVLTAPEIRNLKQTLNITAGVTQGKWVYDGDTLSLQNYEFQISMPAYGKFYGKLLWEEVDLILTTGSGEELGRFNMINAQKEEDGDVLASPDIVMEYTQIRFEGLELPKEEGILLWLSAETNKGISAMVPVSSWATDAAGKMRLQ